MAMEVAKVLYIVVVDTADVGKKTDDSRHSFRYTRSVLQSTLQLMGCKARHAFKISKRVFEMMRTECRGDNLVTSTGNISEVDSLKVLCNHGEDKIVGYISLDTTTKGDSVQSIAPDHIEKNQPFELYKKRTTVVVNRDTFFDIVCNALMEYKYVGLNQRADLALACRIRERKESVTVLLCGTSGCGKSTLSALLASRLGITTVISTDSIRHMMRSFVDEKQNPLLWASTYHAGEHLDPIAVSEAKAKKKAKKSNPQPVKDDMLESLLSEKSPHSCTTTDLISPKQMAVEGYKAQSEMVIDSLDRLITAWEERKESVVVEGVHLSLNFVMGLMKKHPSIIPFMIYISNEEKHMERFAVRAKYMTLDPAKNKYVKYIRNIRTIQEYLCNRADKHLVPKINNTNVDRSVASIHATVFSCLRRRILGDQVYDLVTNTVPVIDEEYRNQCAANSLSSKGMFQLIQRKGSSRHLMALLNIDGSVAKAWPVSSTDGKRVLEYSIENSTRTTPMYGPLVIGKAEPVNLPFGNFGISAWPSDTGGTSHASSVDDLRGGDVTDNGSKYYSSCCSSPRISEAPAKEPMEEDSVHGSDEDDDDSPEVGSDEDLSDDGVEKNNEEVEGSVDEGSSKSDDEYDDLAIEENGYLSDDDEGVRNDVNMVQTKGGNNKNEIEGGERYRQNLDLFLNSNNIKDECKQQQLQLRQPPARSYSAFLRERNEKRATSIGHLRNRKRSMSIPCLDEQNRDFGEKSPVFSGHLLH